MRPTAGFRTPPSFGEEQRDKKIGNTPEDNPWKEKSNSSMSVGVKE